jgi:hypothetical protein
MACKAITSCEYGVLAQSCYLQWRLYHQSKERTNTDPGDKESSLQERHCHTVTPCTLRHDPRAAWIDICRLYTDWKGSQVANSGILV